MNLKNKNLPSLKNDLFAPLDKSKMSKLYGGLSTPTKGTDPYSMTNNNGTIVDDGADNYTD
jgi:hypothetical protein